MLKNIKGLIITIIVLIILIFCSIFYIAYSNLKPISNSSENITFSVNSNTSKAVLSDLKDAGLIKDDNFTYYYIRFIHPVSFKAGTYNLAKNMSFDEIVDYISDAKNAIQNTISITFKEGEWLKHYALKLSEKTNVTYDELIAYWNDLDVLKELINTYPFLSDDILDNDIRYPLEGYLFPNTYEFYRDTNPKEITKKLLDQTLKIYQKYESQFNNSNLSIHELFSLASIVQYEANNKEDMAMVAGVFYNRLAIDMPLQSSVTICYSLDLSKDDDWRHCEYNPDYDSKYNTYKYKGITPGPILNPGEDALKAVLNPSDTDYYYFMADVCGDGKVYYSKDYATHQAYIKKFINCY